MAKKHMKRYSPSLGISGMQIKATIRHHLTSTRMTIGKKTDSNNCWQGYEEIEPSYIVCYNVKWHGPHEKHFGISSKVKHRVTIVTQ